MERRYTPFVAVGIGDLFGTLLEVPGDGDRLLMCLATHENDGGGDSITIVAMASDWTTLTSAVQDEGIYTRQKTVSFRDGKSWTIPEYVRVGPDGKPPRDDHSHDTTGLVVLSVVPAHVRNLNLTGDLEALAENIREMTPVATRGMQL